MSSSGETEIEAPDGRSVIVQWNIDVWRLLINQAPRPVAMFLIFLASLTGLTWQALGNFGAFIEDPIGFVAFVVNQMIINTIFAIGAFIIDGILVLLLGTDRAVGIHPGSRAGIVDFPFLISEPITRGIIFFATGIIGDINGFNRTIADAVAGAGLAAIPLANLLLLIEIGVLAWVVWIVAQTIDIPFIRPVEFVMSLTRPIRRAISFMFR